jgi:hypothetical protein
VTKAEVAAKMTKKAGTTTIMAIMAIMAKGAQMADISRSKEFYDFVDSNFLFFPTWIKQWLFLAGMATFD